MERREGRELKRKNGPEPILFLFLGRMVIAEGLEAIILLFYIAFLEGLRWSFAYGSDPGHKLILRLVSKAEIIRSPLCFFSKNVKTFT
jgi:hypothetical protein